jgi:hypothetical protein
MSSTIGYKMTHDSGFAPNPFHGVLTLATCKPRVRATRQPGDWVAGFASQALVDRAHRAGHKIPYQGLVYLMQVAEVLPLRSYFDDDRFKAKQPPRESDDLVALCGDNIYYRDHRGEYEQLENRHHTRAEMPHDVGGVNTLVAGRFYYFGHRCFVPEGGWSAFLGAPLSQGRTFYCPPGFAEKTLRYFAEHGLAPGMHGSPSLLEGRIQMQPSSDLRLVVRPSSPPTRRPSQKGCGGSTTT